MAKEFIKLPSVWYWSAGLAASAMIGCGSSTPPAPAAASNAPAAQAAPSGTAPMAPGGGPATMPGMNMAGMAPMQQPNPAGGGAPANTDPAAMMSKAHGQGAPPGAPPGTAPGAPPGTFAGAPPGTAPGAPPGTFAGAPPGTAPGAPPGTAPNPGAMAHGQGKPPMPPGGFPGAGGIDPGAMAKAHGQAPPNAPGAAPPAGAPVLPGAAPGGIDPGAYAKAQGGAQNAPPAGQPGFPGAGAPPGAQNGQNPGQFAGGQNPGGQGAKTPKFAEGSAEDVLLKFCTAMADNNLTAAAEYISSKAKGVLVQIRDGSIDDDKLDSMKASFSLSGMQIHSPLRDGGGGKMMSLANSKNEILSFTLAKESGAYKLREFKITEKKQDANY